MEYEYDYEYQYDYVYGRVLQYSPGKCYMQARI